MAWCLTKPQQEKFKKALKDGTIDPFKMASMTSEQRRAVFEKITDPENAVRINALYESKLLLKNQLAGFKTWVKRAAGIKPEIRRDLLSKIERLNELGVLDPKTLDSFKEDLARTRLGFSITFEEAKTINELGQEVAESRVAWMEKMNENPEWLDDPQGTRKEWENDSKRWDYGRKQVILEKYVNGIREQARGERVTFEEDPIQAVLDPVRRAPGFLNDLGKSLMASIDNSFFGRQGIKNLLGDLEQKKIWSRNFAKSFKDISLELQGKEIDGLDALDMIRSDIYSRPNNVNGKYKAGGYQLGVLHEEVFPTSIPEKIPAFGRLFKASEAAFTGAALRMRADLADMLIQKMDAQGLNSKDPKQARGVGHLVGSLTGRGSVNMTAETQKKLNFVFWSFRFLKANIDTLTAHQFDPQATPFSKKEARKQLANVVIQVAGILSIAKLLDPDAVDEDPRSTNFGKLKIFGTWVDITGGMASLVRLAARLTPTLRNGEWGFWNKSSTGNWVNLAAGEYGQRDGMDLIFDGLFANKFAPVMAVARDMYRGEMFGGEPFNIQKAIVNSATPISIQNVRDVKDEKFETILATVITEFFGFGASTYKYEAHWSPKDSEEMKQFFEKVGKDTAKDANESYNRAYHVWLTEVQETEEYKSMSDESKDKLRSSARRAIKEKIFKEYGFKKKKATKTREEREEEAKRKKLKP